MSDWVEYAVEEGRAARKWFGDHYKEVHVAKGGDFAGAKASVDQEAALRTQGAENAARAVAGDLRDAADVVDPDVETPAAETAEPEPVEVPAPPVVAATSLEEVQEQHEARQAEAATEADVTPAAEPVAEDPSV